VAGEHRAQASGHECVDAVVIGGGIIGFAVARELALARREVVVFEAESTFGSHASGRNSEVVHAGIYYPPGSLKAELCVRGRTLLYAYAEREEVAHARLGKLVVAVTDDEVPELERLFARAEANGVADLAWLDARSVRELEPAVRAVLALYSPSSGIVDAHALLVSFKREARSLGAHMFTSTPVLRGRVDPAGVTLELGGRGAGSSVCARTVVNAAGLRAPSVSRSIAGLDASAIPEEHYAKGHYFGLAGPSPFRRLVYPLPVAGGLGVHVTLDLAGRVRFGPDVSSVESLDYAFEDARASDFYTAIRRYYPTLPDGALVPGYTGIRPKLGPIGTSHDFVVQGPTQTGAPGVVALYGIDSPGLTASLAIAERVAALLV
jgi:L-2-hydroxyglutarate oxidase LhgO